MKIGNIDINRGVLLAPMESITDLAFRIICRKYGADIVYSEFISSEAIIRSARKSMDKMKTHPDERPMAIQIFGSNLSSMIQSAKVVEDMGADFLDINFGCWVKKVVNGNAGAAFLKDPEKLAEMAHEVANSVSIPVTAKTRLGWDSNSIVILHTAELLEKTNCAGLTVHCRTRAMGMTGEADWSWINKIREVYSKPLILNGDVKTAEDAKRAFSETSCDAVMVGRAAIGNPFIFRSARALIEDNITLPEPTAEDRVNVCLEHLRISIENKGTPRAINEFRKHYSGYIKGMYNSSSIRQKAVLLDSYEEVEKTMTEYLEFLRVHEDSIQELAT
jgi:tRNA-dihydrouridine synthase B